MNTHTPHTITCHLKSYSNKGGFALIATISVLILLALIAVGLLTLSSLTVRTSHSADAQSKARANARMALLIAIGRLQSAAGPDARVTANSSILDSDPSTNAIDGLNHHHWLGAYPTINPSSPDDGLLSPATQRSWSLANMEWLVSTSDLANTDPTAPLPTPAGSSDNAVTLAQFINDPTIIVPEGDDISSLDPALLSKAQAGLVEANEGSGRFAWWVADESMKARIDTLASVDGSDVLDGTLVDSIEQETSNYQTTQGTNFSEWLPTYDENIERLENLVTPNLLQLVGESATDSSWKDWSRLNQDKFTPFSYSLPVDVANGRLKQDLTAYLKGSYTGLDGQEIIDSRFSITASREPRFDLIKQWANLVDDPSSAQPVSAPDLSNSSVQHGLHPVVTQGAVAMQQAYKIVTDSTISPVFMIMPQFQIWNPHNVPLEAQDYIIQLGYQFEWAMLASGVRNTDTITFSSGHNPEWRSWMEYDSHPELPPHVPAHNESIEYQPNKRFFTFVIKNQAFEPGESLVFFAKPPPSGAISGVPYNSNTDTDTAILNNYSADSELNLLDNEGSLDEFFYFVSDVVGTPTVVFKPQPATITQDDINAEIANKLDTESRFQSNVTGTDLIEDTPDEEDLEMHLNLYAFIDGEASLVHALKKPQKNTRFGNWRRNSYPLGKYLNGSLLASDTYDEKSPLINIGNAMMPSDFKIFTGSSTVNSPPKAGQPHSVLGYWNIRNQESFSRSTNWADSFKPSSWLNAFSFRDVPIFKDTWETTDSLFSNLSMDRLGGWRLSNVPNMSYPFFDYPAGTYGPLSLGSFQHANLSPYGWHPTFAFGNAQAEPRMEREFFQSSLNPDIYDLSYLLNASVWDRYYLSTIPQDGVTLVEKMRLPNSRMSLADGSEGLDFDAANLVNDRGFDFSAAHVLIHGGFNVNSTSHTAWKAFLSGAIGQTVETQHNSVDSHIETAAGMGRFLNPLVEEPDAVANDRTTTDFETVQGWASTRTLSEDEIDTLSKRIVEEVKRRGPFLSLADFVNRRLQASNGASGDEKTYQEILGTLQAAINKATIEDQVINSHYYTGNVNQMKIDPSSSGGEWDSISFSVTDSAKEAMFGYPLSEISSNGGLLHNYAPGFLSQADVLTKIGPSITVRGDTFTIRAYGDSVDSAGNILSKAWCEAVVQRTAKPMNWDGSDDRLIQPQIPSETGLGRQFKIISFRWLTEKGVQPYADDDAITS